MLAGFQGSHLVVSPPPRVTTGSFKGCNTKIWSLHQASSLSPLSFTHWLSPSSFKPTYLPLSSYLLSHSLTISSLPFSLPFSLPSWVVSLKQPGFPLHYPFLEGSECKLHVLPVNSMFLYPWRSSGFTMWSSMYDQYSLASTPAHQVLGVEDDDRR